jgi:hypothetical protein
MKLNDVTYSQLIASYWSNLGYIIFVIDSLVDHSVGLSVFLPSFEVSYKFLANTHKYDEAKGNKGCHGAVCGNLRGKLQSHIGNVEKISYTGKLN